MGDNEKLTPERAIRLLRAKGAELEANLQEVKSRPGTIVDLQMAYLAADIALIAQLLADHIERSNASQVLADAHIENLIERVYALEGGDASKYPLPSWPVENQP